VERGVLFLALVLEDGALFIDGFTNHIDNATQRFRADGYLNRGTRVLTLLSTDQTIRTFHGNGTHRVFTQMLRHFQHQTFRTLGDFHLQGVQNLRELVFELHIDDGSNYLCNLTNIQQGSTTAVGP
jgi:hypothetical protein